MARIRTLPRVIDFREKSASIPGNSDQNWFSDVKEGIGFINKNMFGAQRRMHTTSRKGLGRGSAV